MGIAAARGLNEAEALAATDADDVGLREWPAIRSLLLTQFVRSCGQRPTMARRTSRAADKRKSLQDASEYQDEWGV